MPYLLSGGPVGPEVQAVPGQDPMDGRSQRQRPRIGLRSPGRRRSGVAIRAPRPAARPRVPRRCRPPVAALGDRGDGPRRLSQEAGRGERAVGRRRPADGPRWSTAIPPRPQITAAERAGGTSHSEIGLLHDPGDDLLVSTPALQTHCRPGRRTPVQDVKRVAITLGDPLEGKFLSQIRRGFFQFLAHQARAVPVRFSLLRDLRHIATGAPGIDPTSAPGQSPAADFLMGDL